MTSKPRPQIEMALKNGTFGLNWPPLSAEIRELLEENAALRSAMDQVDEVLVVNWVGPRKDGDYRKALADLVSFEIAIYDDPNVSEVAAKREAELAALRTERDALAQLVKHSDPAEGHGEPCYYCGKPTSDLAADPGMWSVGLCHADEPGVVKWHHTGCVSLRLTERDALREALKIAGETIHAEWCSSTYHAEPCRDIDAALNPPAPEVLNG